MELLLDNKWIDQVAGVRRVLGRPRKEASPVLTSDRPWETAEISGCQAVFRDDEEHKFKLWYRASVFGPSAPQSSTGGQIETSEQVQAGRQHFLCYAESSDGFTWHKPELGLFAFQGSTANNILRQLGGGSNVFGNIQKDPCDPDPGKRYKALEFDEDIGDVLPVRGVRHRGVAVAYSADGLHWPDRPKLVMSADDMTDSNMLFPGRDPHTGKWVCFMRPRCPPKRRFIGFSESDDFEHWTYPRMLLTPDKSDSEFVEFYGLTTIYRQPYYIGLVWVFHNNPYRSPMTNELVFSRDGQNYERVLPRMEFLPLGPVGSSDSRMIIPMGIVPHGKELFVFYSGYNSDHGSDRGQPMPPGEVAPGEPPRSEIGLARLRDGMFSGYGADFEGMIETKWVANYGGPGPQVLAHLEKGGWIKAEILDHYGRVLPGWEREKSRMVQCDDHLIGFTWGEKQLTGQLDDTSPEGGRIKRVIKLRFFLQQAQVFGFSVGNT